MISLTWTKVGEREPNNTGHFYEGSPCSPYVPCLVFACYPGKPQGGVVERIRWDTKNKRWMDSDVQMLWTLQPPYEITHFCDSKIPYPGEIQENAEYQRGVDDANDYNAQWNDPNY